MKRLALFLVATTACTPFVSRAADAESATRALDVAQKTADKTTALTQTNELDKRADDGEPLTRTGQALSPVNAAQDDR